MELCLLDTGVPGRVVHEEVSLVLYAGKVGTLFYGSEVLHRYQLSLSMFHLQLVVPDGTEAAARM